MSPQPTARPATAIDSARPIVWDTAEQTDGILATLADLDRVRWDDDELASTPALDLGNILADPREVDKYDAALSHLEALSAATAKSIARQQARQRAIDEASYQIERAILNAMESAKLTRLHGQFATMLYRRNPPAVRIEDAALIPEKFKRTPPPPAAVPDKTAIRQALDAGQFVPGAVVTRGTRLERK